MFKRKITINRISPVGEIQNNENGIQRTTYYLFSVPFWVSVKETLIIY